MRSTASRTCACCVEPVARRRGRARRRTCSARSSATCSRHRPARRPVHAGRLLLPDDDQAAARVAECTSRSSATSPGSAGSTSTAGHRGARHRAPARRRARDRRRPAPAARAAAAAAAARRAACMLVGRRRGARRDARAARGARARARDRRSTRAASCRSTPARALPGPRRADRRRDGRGRAAARLPGQRPPRRDAARRRPRAWSTTGRSSPASARSWSAATTEVWTCTRRCSSAPASRSRAVVDLRERRARRGSSRAPADDGPASRGGDRLDGAERSTATCSSSRAAASRRTRCSRRPARRSSTTPRRGHLRADRAAGRASRSAARRAASATERAASRARATTRRRRQVLRLHLRGRHREGREARRRRGLRLDRAAKRYTTVTMGPCQGRLCHLRVDPAPRPRDRDATRPRSARRPRARRGRRSSSACSPGRHHEPRSARRSTSATRRPARAMMWTGAWRRPLAYGDAAAEVRAVHERARRDRRLDARQVRSSRAPTPARSSSGSTRTASPTSQSGASATACSTTDGGRIIDDGTIARLGDELFYVTTTSTGSEGVLRVVRVVERRLGLRRRDRQRHRRARARSTSPGPQAREVLARADRRRRLERGASPTSTPAQIPVAGVPCLALRIGFVGELGYELHFPRAPREHLWDALVAGGPRRQPFGLEAAAHPPAREGAHHRRAGHRLRVEPALAPACRGSSSSTRTTSSASARSSSSQERGERERLVGFTMPAGVAAARRARRSFVDGRPSGRVTSARVSEQLGARDRARLGAARAAPRRARDRDPRRTARSHDATVTLGAVLRPRRERGCAA